MGVFIIKPNQNEYERLIRLKNDVNFRFEMSMSEQGFLNAVYRNKWLNIGFKNNANLVIYKRLPEFWRENEKEINIIHFTMMKPWDCYGEDYKKPCEIWNTFNHCF